MNAAGTAPVSQRIVWSAVSDGGSPLVIHRDGNLYFVCGDEKMVPGRL